MLIAGPTASGKSALALSLAGEIGGTVINADSMQVYRDLRIITARPTPEDEASLPHRLYGHVDAAENYSVGRWLADVTAVLGEVRAAGRVPILVGGTGLYFKALTQGLSQRAADSRCDSCQRACADGGGRSGGAAWRTLRAATPQPRSRPVTARASHARWRCWRRPDGRSPDWHGEGLPPLIDASAAVTVFLAPERPELRKRIDARFDAMLDAGALDEVRALAVRKLDPLLPAMKAHGVPWLIRHLNGEIH